MKGNGEVGRTLTVKQVAELLNLSTAAIYQAAARGRLQRGAGTVACCFWPASSTSTCGRCRHAR
jgi:hypothetical protein